MSAHSPQELQNAFGFLYADELSELTRLAMALPPKPVIVNIGAGVGTSAATFLSARQDCALFTVDINPGVSPFGGLGNERIALTDMGLIPHDRYFAIPGDSKQVAKEWQAGWGLDLLFIDGDHSFEGASGDILGWLPYLKPGGYVAIHDYGKAYHYLRLQGLPDTTPITEEILTAAKSYPGVDEAVRKYLLSPDEPGSLAGQYQLISHIDSLITFKKL